jgi:hypothetical protein
MPLSPFKKNHRRQYLWITLFAIGMAFLESAVVIYLRALYYPEGFAFPLKQMDSTLALTELIREAATMLMLVSVAALASRRFTVAVAWFIYAFAVWDIFYYVFLWLMIGWPASFLTWDLLFLLPVMWVGPVIAPVINSLTMILLAVVIIHKSTYKRKIRLDAIEWMLLIAGSFITIFAYTQDYMLYMLHKFSFLQLVFLQGYSEVLNYSSLYIPQSFNWWMFSGGEGIFLVAVMHFALRRKKSSGISPLPSLYPPPAPPYQ